ncbi:MAG: LCP family protein [Candidatus Dormiibacterota bacterium]
MSAPVRRRRRSAGTIALRFPRRRLIAAAGIALILAVVSYTGIRFYLAAAKVSPGHSSLGDVLGLAQNQDDTPGTLAYKIHHGERVNILMLGYGGAGHDGAFLSDSIMMISVEGPDRVAMTSLPRDTYAKVAAFANGGTYAGKINAAHAIPLSNGAFGTLKADYTSDYSGGGKLASQVIGDYLGVPIDYWVSVDFTAFKKVVDAIGGVDINNPYVLDDYQYPIDATGGYQHIHFNAGPQHLSGDQALIYVRERHADSDFGRSRRQQQVVAAIKDKTVSVNAVPQLFTLLDALSENVHTNLSLNDMRTFSGILNKVDTAGTHHVSIDNSNWQYDTTDSSAGYILLARDKTMNSLHHFIDSELPDPAVLGENANVAFSSTTGQASNGQSLAGIMSAVMGMINFKTLAPINAATAPATTEVRDYSGGKATKTAQWMATYFGGTVVTMDPATKPAPDAGASPQPGASPTSTASPDIVVVLGKDFASAFDQAERPTYSPPSNYIAPRQSPRQVQPTQAPMRAPSSEPTVAASQSPKPKCSPLPGPGCP